MSDLSENQNREDKICWATIPRVHHLNYNGVVVQASRRAILNANYMAARLKDHYKVLYTGKNGTCAHEFIIDLRPMKVC